MLSAFIFALPPSLSPLPPFPPPSYCRFAHANGPLNDVCSQQSPEKEREKSLESVQKHRQKVGGVQGRKRGVTRKESEQKAKSEARKNPESGRGKVEKRMFEKESRKKREIKKAKEKEGKGRWRWRFGWFVALSHSKRRNIFKLSHHHTHTRHRKK